MSNENPYQVEVRIARATQAEAMAISAYSESRGGRLIAFVQHDDVGQAVTCEFQDRVQADAFAAGVADTPINGSTHQIIKHY